MKSRTTILLLSLICVAAVYTRSAGLYRGLGASPAYVFHSDSSRQVSELRQFLQDKYIHYEGNRTHDGYPYFLNHFDEWILRVAWPIYRSAHSFLNPDNPAPSVPDTLTLFYWVRSLRVLYGLAVVLLVYAIGRAMQLAAPAAGFAALAMALAPLSIAVSHSATGDIGTDLFSSLALLFLVRFGANDGKRWLAALGVAIAFTFASKYHGLLCGLPVFIYLLLQFDKENAGRWTAGTIIVACAFLCGVAIAMPHLVTSWDRSTDNILAYLAYVQDHRVEEAFLQKSLPARAWFGIAANSIPVLGALGLALAVLALVGTAHAGLRLLQGLRRDPPADPSRRRATLTFAICIYPWIVLILALTLKRNVQPFHFSFVQIPVALGAAYAMHVLWNERSLAQRVACGLVACIVLLELGHATKRELYFWKREDSRRTAKIFDASILRFGMTSKKWPHDSGHVVKKLFLEPPNPSMFRNRPRCVLADDLDYWVSNHVPLCATIPFPNAPYWIFCNGPIFPRNDRMFHVPGRTTARRELVLHKPPGRIQIGLRSASHPVDVSISLGGDRKSIRMEPNRQEIVTLAPTRWRSTAAERDVDEDIHLVPLKIESRSGDAWTTVLHDERAVLNFRTFGYTDLETLRARLDVHHTARYGNPLTNAFYLVAPSGYDVTLGDDPSATVDLLPPATVLANGAYILKLSLTDVRRDLTIDLVVVDPVVNVELDRTAQQVRAPAGVSRVEYRFSKPFAPYRSTIRLRCRGGQGRLVGWELVPDTERIMGDLQTAIADGNPPDWSARFDSEWEACHAAGDAIATFRGSCDLLDLQIPREVRSGQHVRVTCCVKLNGFPSAALPESAFFAHILDSNGERVADLGWALASCAHDSGAAPRQTLRIPEDVSPGTYEIMLGMWNTRLRDRYAVRSDQYPVDLNNRLLKLGEIRIY